MATEPAIRGRLVTGGRTEPSMIECGKCGTKRKTAKGLYYHYLAEHTKDKREAYKFVEIDLQFNGL